MQVDALAAFIKAREQLRVNRERGLPRERWTGDPILQKYRFCNVRREDDRVTRWIAENWRKPHQGDQHLWFAMLAARYINLPVTLQHLGYLVPYRAHAVLSGLNACKTRNGVALNGAYMITTHCHKTPLYEYIAYDVLEPAWTRRLEICPRKHDSLAAFAERLLTLTGVSGFMAGQVVADAKYAPPLLQAPDWDTWAISGGGSRRGMNRLLGRPTRKTWKEPEWFANLTEVRARLNEAIGLGLHAQDVQNCLCEFDKYERARLGEGRPKQVFVPLEERSA